MRNQKIDGNDPFQSIIDRLTVKELGQNYFLESDLKFRLAKSHINEQGEV